MDSLPPVSALEPVTTGSAAPDTSEISELIIAEHARILRLFGALDDLARRANPAVTRSALAQVWTRLAELLVAHIRAEEEICFPPMRGTGARTPPIAEAAAADHDDIRAAVEQARFCEVGSPRWWRVITRAHTICAEHFDREEQGLLRLK